MTAYYQFGDYLVCYSGESFFGPVEALNAVFELDRCSLVKSSVELSEDKYSRQQFFQSGWWD